MESNENLPMFLSRVEKAYLLVDAPSINEDAVLDEIAGMAFSHRRHVLIEKRGRF